MKLYGKKIRLLVGWNGISNEVLVVSPQRMEAKFYYLYDDNPSLVYTLWGVSGGVDVAISWSIGRRYASVIECGLVPQIICHLGFLGGVRHDFKGLKVRYEIEAGKEENMDLLIVPYNNANGGVLHLRFPTKALPILGSIEYYEKGWRAHLKPDRKISEVEIYSEEEMEAFLSSYTSFLKLLSL